MERVGFVGSFDEAMATYESLVRGPCELAVWWPDDVDDDRREVFDGRRVDLEELADRSLIFFNPGIERCRRLARRLGDVITGRQIIVHTMRSIEADTLNTASKILHEETPTRRIGFVTGPTRLEDIRRERPASAVCASHFPEVHQLVEEAMMSSKLRVYHAQDLVGAELSAVYARLIALMSGLARGLGLGASLQATLFARGLAEMARFVDAHEGQHRTPFGLAGAGNLYADTIGEDNVDFQMGQMLAEDGDEARDPARIVEHFGAPARELFDILTAFEEAGERTDLDLYLLDATAALMTAGLSATDVVQNLMTLPALEE